MAVMSQGVLHLALSTSVGTKGGNRRDDVIRVQDALNTIPQSEGAPGTLLTLDGIAGPRTCGAIQQLQLKHFGWKGADGRIDPGGRTATLVSQLLSKHGSTTWGIRRLEATVAAAGSKGRTVDSRDRFFEIADSLGVRRVLYYFVPASNPFLARASTIPPLRGHPSFCAFTTVVPCGPFSFAGTGNYSEHAPDEKRAVINLTLRPAAGHVTPGAYSFPIQHHWLQPMTVPGNISFPGILQFVRDESGGQRKKPRS